MSRRFSRFDFLNRISRTNGSAARRSRRRRNQPRDEAPNPWFVETLENRLLLAGDLVVTVDPTVTTIHDETDFEQNTPPNLDATTDENGNDIALTEVPAVLDTTGAIGAALSGYDGSNDGLDVFTITSDLDVNNLALTDASGDLLDGDDSGLDTVAGNDILLFTQSNDNIVFGIEEGTGDTVFAIYLEENATLTTGKFWTVQYEAIAHPLAGDGSGGTYDEPVNLDGQIFVTASRDLEFDLTNAPSGQNLFIMFGDGSISNDPSEVGIVATGQFPANESAGENITSGDTVNTSQGGIGPATFGVSNQLINEGEGLLFTFVSQPDPDFTVPNLTPGEAVLESSILFGDFFDAKAAEFQVVQLQSPNSPSASSVLTISAYNETELAANAQGDNYVDAQNANLSDPSAIVAITSVEVFEIDGVTPAAGVTIIDNGDGTFTLEGVQAGDFVRYFTDGDHNRVLIENTGDGKGKDSADFDIGGFKLIQADTASANVGATLNWEDDGPAIDLELAAGALLQTDDGGLAGGNAGGVTTDSAGVNDLFTVTESAGTDGDAGTAYSLVLGANTTTTLVDVATGENVVLSNNGGVIEGRTEVSGELVFTVSVNSATGEVTLNQLRPVQHSAIDTAAPYNGDTVGLGVTDAVNLSATLSDGDADTATDAIDISSTLQFTDDGPDIDLELAAGALLQTDDGGLAGGNAGGVTTDSAGVNDLFTVTESPGADGDAGTVYSLVLGANTTTTLQDAATDETVVLIDNGGVVEGRTDTSNLLVFTVSVDSGTGEVTLDQERSVEHSTIDTAAPYNGDITGLGVLDAINLSATLSDGDADTATDAIDISSTLQFTDDGPDIDLELAAGALLQTDDGGLAGGNAGGVTTDSAGVNDLFTVTESPGADGDAGTVYSLVLGANTTTTLQDAATDETVVLIDNGGVVEGRTDTSNLLVFTVSVDSGTGEVTLDQERSVEHSTIDTAAPYNGDITGLGVLDAINLSATLSDGDADTATDAIDISSTLQFTDDGPDIDLELAAGALLQTDDGGLAGGNAGGVTTDSAGVNDLFTVTESPGADGDAGTVYSLVLGANTTTTLQDAATDETVVLIDNGGVVEGRTDTSNLLVFTVSVDSGTGEVTLDQERSVEHSTIDTAAPYNGDITGLGVLDAINLSATLSDGDADTATDAIDISSTLQFTDDGPDIDLELAAGALLQTDDGGLAGGNAGGVTTDSAGVNDLFTVTESPGADGDAGTVYSLVLGANTTTTLQDAATDETVVLIDNGGVVEGRTDTSNLLVFTVSVDSGTGEVTLDQERSVEHSTIDTAAPYNGDLTGLGVLDAINLSATLSDGDADTATDAIDISSTLQFTDDGPDIDLELAVGALLQTDDGGLAGGNAGGVTTDSAGVGDLFNIVSQSAGADGDAGTSFALALGANTTTTLLDAETDEAIALSLNGSVVEGRTETSNLLVFTVSVDSATGEVTLDQERSVEHSTIDTAAPYNGDTTGLGVIDAILLSAVLTDGDGDTATDSIDISNTLLFTDDGPEVDFSNLVGTVTTEAQVGFWSESAGADQPGTLSVTADGNFEMVTPDGVSSTGTVTFDPNTGTGTLTADFDNDSTNGDETIGFSLTVNQDGTYVFTLDEVVVPVVVLSTDEGQLPAGGPDPVQTLSFVDTSIVFFAVDADTAEAGGTFGPTDIVPAIELGEPDLTEAELEAGAAPPIGNNTFPFIREDIEMNVSTSGIGVNNNVLQGEDLDGDDPGTINAADSGAFDESFVINPEPLASEVKVFISKTAGGFLPPNPDGSLQGTPAKTDYLYYNVYDEFGNDLGPILVTSDIVFDEADVAAGGTGENLWSFTVDIDDLALAGDSIDAIQFTMGFGDIKIPKIEIVVRGDTPPNDIFLDFGATLTDADGDTASTNFAIDLVGNDVDATFDYTLADAGDPSFDAFDVNVVLDPTSYLITGFDPGNLGESDQLYLLNGSGFVLNTGSDLGVGTAAPDSEVIVNGVTVIVEDATLTEDDITDGLSFLAEEEPAEDDGLVMLLV